MKRSWKQDLFFVSINIFMKFLEFAEIFEKDESYNPSKDEIRHFNQIRSGKKIDYSKDLLNVTLKKLYNISLKISDNKIRDKFSFVIFRNMGNLENLISEIEKLNKNFPNNCSKDFEEVINKIKEEN